MSIDIGKRGEDRAADFITQKGMLIIDRNFRTKIGEIDIIAVDEDVIAFVEVKSRKTDSFGNPSEFVNWYQRRRIINTAQIYMKQKNLTDMQPRFDVCEIYSSTNTVNYIENAFPFL